MKTIKTDLQGFTLIEILVATLIFSVTLLTLFSAFNAFLSSGSLVKNEVTQNDRFRLGLKTILSDLEQIFVLHPPRYIKPEFNSQPDSFAFKGTPADDGGNDFSQLSFTSLNHSGLVADPGNGVAKIVYYVNRHEDRFDLLRSDRLAPYPDEPDPCSDPVLFKDITGFKLTYTDINGDEHDSWDSESKEFNFIFPAKVQMKIMLGANSRRSIVTAITLPTNRKALE